MAFSFMRKSDDKRYKIVSIEGIKTFENNFNECLELKDKIVKNILRRFRLKKSIMIKEIIIMTYWKQQVLSYFYNVKT